MKSFFNRVLENHALIYKVLLYLLSVFVIVYLFPKGGQFKYQFQKGQVWHYDDFTAPFDFALLKTQEELQAEKQAIRQKQIPYFTFKDSTYSKSLESFQNNFDRIFKTTPPEEKERDILYQTALTFIENEYKKGYLAPGQSFKLNDDNRQIAVKQGNKLIQVSYDQILTDDNIQQRLDKAFQKIPDTPYKEKCVRLLRESVKYNLYYDKVFTEKALKEELQNILPTKGFFPKGTPIISKGATVEGTKFEQLTSIAKAYESKIWSKANWYWLVTAYTFLVALALMMLLFFIKKYRIAIYRNSSKITFVFVQVMLMVFITTFVLKFNANFLYVIPFVILPLIVKAFFDARLGLFTHVLTILLLGFIVPNSFEFIFIQIIAGIVTILTVSELNKRANLFISVAQITGVYLLAYIAFSITKEGNASGIGWMNVGLFALNGMITASLVIPLIFLFEKLFGLVSDESLREYSDSNNKLLKELNEKAPGTFQHSMQVANLAETAAKEIGANALLVRTGALYHDIGKMFNPLYFTENQATSVNPHNELSPEDSAQIIINHIIQGIELAKKHKLPDRLIDFIRTHHGTSYVYYFYKMEANLNPDSMQKEKFRYPGPIPFSKETAILMICDAAEAASKSLKEPTAIRIDQLIDKIVKGQMDNGQFNNADITFKEIEKVKKVVKKKLNNIYHLRIEYPE